MSRVLLHASSVALCHLDSLSSECGSSAPQLLSFGRSRRGQLLTRQRCHSRAMLCSLTRSFDCEARPSLKTL